MRPTAVLPGGTNWQATMLPVETIIPFFRDLPCAPSLLASAVRAGSAPQHREQVGASEEAFSSF